MSSCCSGSCSSDKPPVDRRYRRILWVALCVNALMFGVEIIGGLQSGSVSLLADAVDFFGDATNYGISLFVLGMGTLWRSRTALIKGLSMGGYGLFVLASAAWNVIHAKLPHPEPMAYISVLALLANLSVALLLYAYRNGDADMRSVWLCSRNDAIGNIAVMLAALGVFGTGSGWPDALVALGMGILAISAARSVIMHARAEMRPVSPASGIALSRPAQSPRND